MQLIWIVPAIVQMKLASLYSGGKDSTYSIVRAREMGHEVSCLITMHPASDDSLLFHYPNIRITRYLAEAMQIPLVECSSNGGSKEEETSVLEEAILQAKTLHGIEGVLHGGISSNFQKEAFGNACRKHGLTPIAPIWRAEALAYMNQLVDTGFRIMIVAVSAMGLGKEWLGTVIDRHALEQLHTLSKKFGFNLTFEGGEAETLVIDCPLFRKRLEIKAANTRWDGQRGIFEILEVALVEK